MRIASFVISLLLLGGAADPTRGWLIALTVVTGLTAFRPRFWDGLSLKPAIDVRLGAFVFAVLLLGGAIEPTRDSLIGLSVVTGVAMVAPKLIAIDLFGERERRRTKFWYWTTENPFSRRMFDDWGWRAQSEFDRWGNSGRQRRPPSTPRAPGDEWS